MKRLTVCFTLALFVLTACLPAMAGASFLELLNRSDKYPEVEDFVEALAAGADPNERNSWNSTPLTRAIEKNRADLIIFLIDNGANPRAKLPDQVGGRKPAAGGLLSARSWCPDR